jgi:hypothetical protein
LLKGLQGFVENLRNRINLLWVVFYQLSALQGSGKAIGYRRALTINSIPKPIDIQLAGVKYNLFTEDFVKKPDGLEYTKEPYPTNGDRCMAAELLKRGDTERFTKLGFVSQAIAAGWHHKSPAQLAELGDKVGRHRIMVIHGGKDRMITFPHGEVLLEGLGGQDKGVTKRFLMEQGHVIPIEMRKEFMGWMESHIEKAEALGKA